MREALIIDAVRSPMGRGKAGGSLSEVHPVDLLAQVLRALVARHRLDPGMIDDVMVGCVSQGGEQSGTPGRMAVLAAGFPEHVPSTTIDRKCGSSQQAVHFAAQAIMAGAADIVIAAGVESMSRVPMGSARMDKDATGPMLRQRYAPGLVGQGISAELVAARWKLPRETLDEYSVQSHARAAKARDAGAFDAEIVPVEAPAGTVRADETIRPATTAQSLATLKTSFANDEMHRRFPEIAWSFTAGNSSQITDGAAAMLVVSDAAAQRLGLTPRGRFVAFDVVGADPLLMLTAPIPATARVLRKAGLAIDDIDHFEINEAFAPVPLAWQKDLGADPAKLNPRGGAIALGHPLGATGVRLMTTMLNALEQTGGRYGLQSMCEAGGMANATVIERIGAQA